MLQRTQKGLKITEQQAQIGSACGEERLSPMAGGQVEQDTLAFTEHLAPMAGGGEQLHHTTMAGRQVEQDTLEFAEHLAPMAGGPVEQLSIVFGGKENATISEKSPGRREKKP